MDTSQRIKRVNLVFAATVALSMIAGFLPIGKWIHNSAVLLLLSQLILFLPAAVYLVTSKISYREAVRFRKIRPANIILLILLTILIMPMMSLINALSMVYVENRITNTMTAITSQNFLWISLLVTAVLPCILEESVYRGVLYNEYRKVKPLAAIFLSAFLFGILHGNLNQFSYAFAMGIVFAFIIEATDSILSTMIVHFLINAGSILTLAFYPKLIAFLESVYNTALEKGNTATVNLVTQLMGGTDFTMDALMENSQQTLASMTVWDVLRNSGPTALVCMVLAFIVYRTIAINADRWEAVKGLFTKKNNTAAQEKLLESGMGYKESSSSQKLITLPLGAAMLFCVTLMILSELL